MSCIPVLITVYNRFKHVKQCIESLQKNDLAKQTDLYVASDAAYRDDDIELIEKIRTYLKDVSGFNKVHVISPKENLGNVKSTVNAKKIIFSRHDSLILMEDDIQVSSTFLEYMNSAMNKYKGSPEVFSVTGYQHPYKLPKSYPYDAFFMPALHAWGVGMYREKENAFLDEYFFKPEEFIKKNSDKIEGFKKLTYEGYRILMRDINGELIAGDVRRGFYQYCRNMVSLIPARSLTKSNGHDGSGKNCPYDYALQNQSIDNQKRSCRFPEKVEIDPLILKIRARYFGNFMKKVKILKRYYYNITRKPKAQ